MALLECSEGNAHTREARGRAEGRGTREEKRRKKRRKEGTVSSARVQNNWVRGVREEVTREGGGEEAEAGEQLCMWRWRERAHTDEMAEEEEREVDEKEEGAGGRSIAVSGL